MPPSFQALAAAALAAGLAGCGGPEGVFRADRASPLLTAPPLVEPAGGGVWVAPIGEADAEPFRRALAAALVRREVPAGVDSAGPLSVKLIAVPGRPTHAGRGFVAVAWRVEDADGAVIDAFSVPTPLDFRVERPETRAAIAAVADRVDLLLDGPEPEAETRRLAVAVPPALTRGFEDGGPLSRAMAQALGAHGFQPGADADTADAVVRPAAVVTPAEGRPGEVVAAIRWTVLARDGREVGAVEQRNLVPAAQAADGLVAIAADAAGAAAESVAGLIRRAAAEDAGAASTASERAGAPLSAPRAICRGQ